MARLALTVALPLLLVLAVPAANAPPPAGATAQCRDRTYSFSQHHSGTCSHHGGVALWFGGHATGAVTPVSTAAVASVVPGTTILLAKQKKTDGCKLSANPDHACSPGAYYSKLTKAVICSSTFRTGPIRNVPDSEKHQVEAAYGLEPKPYGSTLEIDHIVSLELGGSNDPANLVPEQAAFASNAPGFHVKDLLENAVHKAVCSGKLSLRSAQQQIASNWQRLYKRLFGVASAP